MKRWKDVLGPDVSLTDLFSDPQVRSAWKEYLPLTRQCISSINRLFEPKPLIGSCLWVSDHNRYGYLGTIYDHAIGLLLAGRCSLLSIRGLKLLPARLQLLFDPIEDLLSTEADAIRDGQKGDNQLDLFLALALLTDLHAKATGHEPALPLKFSKQVRSIDPLRELLRNRYPHELGQEIQQLCAATMEDLPRGGLVQHKPHFSNTWEKIEVYATGDLLIGDTLFELKVSKRLFRGDHLWQLLGYTAIDSGGISALGGYNPRHRALWKKPVDELARAMGSPSFKAFRKWFRAVLPSQMKSTGIKFIRVK